MSEPVETKERRTKVRALWHEGKSCNQIAKLIDSSPATVMRDCRAMDLPLNKKEREAVQASCETDDDPDAELWNHALYCFKSNELKTK
ncbi:MAG: helix-turn-helix domain-containing protein [Methyloprofundus sp.]|nr:helix-turn-helix domain-containing protein [Methyloprofundus sp.]